MKSQDSIPPSSESDARPGELGDQTTATTRLPNAALAVALSASSSQQLQGPAVDFDVERAKQKLSDDLKELKALLVEAEQDENQTKLSGDATQGQYSWLREAAILLAGASGLLYLTSHIWGSSYLGIYGVEGGFHSFGLGNLSMLTFVDIASLVIFANTAYRAIYAAKQWQFILDLAFIAIGASSWLLIAVLIQGGFTAKDATIGLLSVVLAWGWIYMTRRLATKFKASHDSYQASYQSFLKRFGESASEGLKVKQDIPAEIATLLTEIRDVIEPVRRRLGIVKRRVRVFDYSSAFLLAFWSRSLFCPT